MKRRIKTSEGFGALEAVIIVVVLGLVGGLGYRLYSQRQKTAPQPTPAKRITSTIETKTEAPAPAPAPKPAQTPPADATASWKTYKSPLSGYTVKYPADWVTQQDGTGTFTNSLGGSSSYFRLQSTKRTGSYDGHDANTYMCVNVSDYTTEGWSGFPQDTTKLTALSKIKPNATTELTLALSKAPKPMLSQLFVSDGHDNYISVNSKYMLEANAQFDCVQGDSTSLEGSTEAFLNRKETTTAKLILESIRY